MRRWQQEGLIEKLQELKTREKVKGRKLERRTLANVQNLMKKGSTWLLMRIILQSIFLQK